MGLKAKTPPPGSTTDVRSDALTVSGAVGQMLALSLDDLKAMPRTTVETDLRCVDGQDRDGFLMRAKWTGVGLAYLLDKADISSAAMKIALYDADGYATDLQLAAGMDDETIVAYEMEGEPLADGLRLVAPNLWGYKWIRKLKDINLKDFDFKGTWETIGYSDTGLP